MAGDVSAQRDRACAGMSCWQLPPLRGPLSSLKAPAQASPPPQHLSLQTCSACLSWFHVKIVSWLPFYSFVPESRTEIVLFFFLFPANVKWGRSKKFSTQTASFSCCRAKRWCKWQVLGDTGNWGRSQRKVRCGHLALLLQIQKEQLPGLKRWA